MPNLSLSEITLYFEQDGAGEPLLLIAGIASDSASWLPLIPHLSGNFSLIRPDNRSTGRTIPPDAPTDLHRNAADCVALLDHLGVEKAHVLGHSMGGLVAMELATACPDRVGSLTLAAIAPLRSARNVALFDALIAIRRSNAPPDTWLRAFFPWLFAPPMFNDPAAIDAAVQMALAYPFAQPVEGMERQLRALDSYDPTHLDIRTPVQALLGGYDILMPEGPARDALARIDGIDIKTIATAAHSVHWDAPQIVADHIRAFAAQHPL
ncbi:MAG: alpha/beta fold hydrolase [Pseudomonadota bacterium]